VIRRYWIPLTQRTGRTRDAAHRARTESLQKGRTEFLRTTIVSIELRLYREAKGIL
jgi:hypothetical protein